MSDYPKQEPPPYSAPPHHHPPPHHPPPHYPPPHFHPPPHHHPPPPMHPDGPVVAVVVGGPALGPSPANIVCPSCHAHIQTQVTHENSSKTHLMALLLCCCICWPCAWMPYCMDSCRTANHHCPCCGAFLGSHKN